LSAASIRVCQPGPEARKNASTSFEIRTVVCVFFPEPVRPRLDRLQLLGVPDQHHLGVGFLSHLEHPRQWPCAHHAGLIDDEHIARRERIPPPVPRQFITRQGARLNAGGLAQILRRDAGERRSLHRQTFRLPGLAHRRERRALGRPGHPDQRFQIARAGDVLERLALLIAQPIVREHRHLPPPAHPMAAAHRQLLRIDQQRTLFLEHLPRREPLPSLLVGAMIDPNAQTGGPGTIPALARSVPHPRR